MAVTSGKHPIQAAGQPALSRLAGSAISALHTLLGLALLFVVAVNVLNATSRYLFGVSPVGADELMVYVVIWAVMVAAILSLVLRSHINVNVLPLYTTGRARHLLHLLHDAAAVFACGYAAYASWLFIGRISKLGVTSMGLGLPMSVPHAALLFGFLGLTVAGAVMFVRDAIALARNSPHVEVAP
jgi:TRAP-type C4-dicarboxylate transport system permease small subunit